MFIARQPIFDRLGEVFGYELLFRKNSNSIKFEGISSAEATRVVITGLFESGMDAIVGDSYAFVNFDEIFIHSQALELIEPSKLVVEILEDVKIDDNLIKRVDELRDRGYKVALDDFFENYLEYPLTAVADIIKYDIRQTPLALLEADLRLCIEQNKIPLAEKVETQQEFIKARDMGFRLFQGYFFSKPRIVEKTSRGMTTKLQYALLLKELRKKEPSYSILSEIIEKDVSLVYKLMRVIKNRVGEGELIDSIKKALTYMGLKEVERWINITMLNKLAKDKPLELFNLAIQRSKFLELIAKHSEYYQGKEYESFMSGLFSTIDAILDQEMEDALKNVMIPKSTFDCLALKKGDIYPLFELAISYEIGHWDKVKQLSEALKIDDRNITSDYLNSIDYTNRVSREVYDGRF